MELELEVKQNGDGARFDVFVTSKLTGNTTKMLVTPFNVTFPQEALKLAVDNFPLWLDGQRKQVLENKNVWLIHECFALGILPKSEWPTLSWDGPVVSTDVMELPKTGSGF